MNGAPGVSWQGSDMAGMPMATGNGARAVGVIGPQDREVRRACPEKGPRKPGQGGGSRRRFPRTMTQNSSGTSASISKSFRSGTERLETAAEESAHAIVTAHFAAGNKILTFGNGGSSAEASHLAEELMGRFRKTRQPFPCDLALSSDSGTVTCISNDFGYEALFERQVEAPVQTGDIAVALTTSGKSENVNRASACSGESKRSGDNRADRLRWFVGIRG